MNRVLPSLRRLGLGLLFAVMMFTGARVASAQTDGPPVDQDYLNLYGYCCDPLAESNGGRCTPGYPSQSACLDPAIGGVVYTEKDPVGCTIACGKHFGLFYCPANPQYGQPISCTQTPVSTGGVPYGYTTAETCATACAPPEPVSVTDVACRCATTATVICDITIGAPVTLERAIQRSPAGQAGTVDDDSLTADLLAQDVSLGTALTTGTPPANTPAPVSTSPSRTVVVNTWISGGSPTATTANWVERAEFTPTGGNPSAVSPECGATNCDFTIQRARGVLSVRLNRTDLPRVTGGNLFYHAKLQPPPAPPANSQNPNPTQDASGISDMERSGRILTVEQCSDQKLASVSECRLPTLYRSNGSNAEPPRQAFATYTITVPQVRGTTRVVDNVKYYDSDPYDCLQQENLSVQANLLLHVQGEPAQIPLSCGAEDSAPTTCCTLIDGQVRCDIRPPESATNAPQTYVLTIKDIPVRLADRCKNVGIWNKASVEQGAASSDTNVTQITAPGCLVSQCDQCWYQEDAQGNRITQSTCTQNSKCQWQAPAAGEENGYCRPKVDICPGFFGCCYRRLERVGAEGRASGPRTFAWGARSSEGGPVNGQQIRLVNGRVEASDSDPNAYMANALACFGYTSSQGNLQDLTVRTTAERLQQPTSQELQRLINDCVSPRPDPTDEDSSSSRTGNSDSSDSSSSRGPRPNVWCPSDDAVDMRGVTFLDDFDGQDLQDGGMIMARVPRGLEMSPTIGRYYKRGATEFGDPAYDDEGFTFLTAATKNAREACVDSKQYAICLTGNPNGNNEMECSVQNINTCAAARGLVIPGRTLNELNDCVIMQNGINAKDPQVMAAIGAGQQLGAGVVGAVQNPQGVIDMVLQGIANFFN